MAKDTKPATVTVGKFQFDTGLPVPPRSAGFGARTSETAEKLKALPVGASFLEAVHTPGNITDPTEREKSFREAARQVANRLSGAIRRFKKANAGYEFASHVVADDALGHGVRVWRVEAEPTAPAEEGQAAA